MNIDVLRVRRYPTRTQDQIYVDGDLFCFGLEDVDREILGTPVIQWKIFGQTAIPLGTYELTLENSPKFGAATMTINAVPGYSGVRIHAGNNENDTEGCLILGYQTNNDGMILFGTTKPAVADLKKLLLESRDATHTITFKRNY